MAGQHSSDKWILKFSSIVLFNVHQIFINLNFFAFHWEYLNILGTRGHKKFQSKPFPKNKKLHNIKARLLYSPECFYQDELLLEGGDEQDNLNIEVSGMVTNWFQLLTLLTSLDIFEYLGLAYPSLQELRDARIPQGVVFFNAEEERILSCENVNKEIDL